MLIATVIPEPAVLAMVACPVPSRKAEALKTSGKLNIPETLIGPLAVGGLLIDSTNATLQENASLFEFSFMFVPSLSWYDDAFLVSNGAKYAFSYLDDD
jgi:hypothetical protein